MKFMGLAAAAVAVAGLAGAAEAATLGTIGPGNDGIGPLWGPATAVEGWFGAQLYALGNVTADIEFWGSEAGYNNTFNLNGSQLFNTGGGTNSFSLKGTVSGVSITSGLIDFWFGANNNSASIANGSNVLPDSGSPNFFLSFGTTPDTNVNGSTPGSGQSVWLFFDDYGAGPDDNHDDMIVRFKITSGSIGTSPVPVPAGGLLLLGGLAGLAALRRRKAQA